MSAKSSALLPPIEAYDRLASRYAEIRSERQRYCDGIDRLISESIPPSTKSMLDVGSGDGARAASIAQGRVEQLVLLEPSPGMRKLIRSGQETWTAPIEMLEDRHREFDIITCLWNVLGHVQGRARQLRALRNMRSLLTPHGSIFLDVQNRYNAHRYGWTKTLARYVRDRFLPSAEVGDVVVRWPTSAGDIRTYGHVFTPREIRSLVQEAGLQQKQIRFIDYETGEERNSQFAGSIFLELAAQGQ